MASATEGKLFASVPGDIQHCNEYSIAETVFVCVCVYTVCMFMPHSDRHFLKVSSSVLSTGAGFTGGAEIP